MPKSLPVIRTDTSGNLSSDIFFSVSNWGYGVIAPEKDKRTLPPQLPGGVTIDDCVRTELYESEEADEEAYRCAIQPPHHQQIVHRRIRGELWGKRFMTSFVIDQTADWLVVNSALGERLRQTTLRGLLYTPYEIAVNQSDLPDPKLQVLQSRGANCARPLMVDGAENACPFCGKTPVICPQCGYNFWKCASCGSEMSATLELRKGQNDRRLVRTDACREPNILEGVRWDGSDLLRSHTSWYMSKRMAAWLTQIHAGPLIVRPVRFCTDGMSTQQKCWLDAALDVATVERD